MSEKPVDAARAAGMCPHGNFPSTCHLCVSTKQETESEVASRVENHVTEELRREVSVERKTELNRELAAVVDFFSEAGIQPYIAGGTGIDLIDGEWDRDHQDLDMAIFGNERQKFYEAAAHAGFVITDPDHKSLTLDEISNRKTHNAFLFRSDPTGATQFEVIFLNETASGDIELTHHAATPRASYEHAPTRTLANKEVRLQPPEIILFHKLTDGRRKDFRDAKKVWEGLEPDQKKRLEQSLADANVRFVIGGQEIRDIPTLFVSAQQADAAKHRQFFDTKLSDLDRELSKDLVKSCEDVFEIRQRTPDRSAFFNEVAEKYQGFIPERRIVMEEMANTLYSDPAPDIEQFKTWARGYVKIDGRLNHKALTEYVSEKLWETKLENQE